MRSEAASASSTSDVLHPISTERHDDVSSRTTVDSRFSCNICLDQVTEPVVTQCGHLYCWPCLYKWLEPGMYPEERAALGLGHLGAAVNGVRRACPVCKSPCSVPTLVPIYVRAHEHTPVNHASQSEDRSRAEALGSGMDQGDTGESAASATLDASEEDNNLDDINATTGLRRRYQSQSNHDTSSHFDDVPSRPAANSPQVTPPSSSPSTPPHQRQQQQQPQGLNPVIHRPVWLTPLSPTGHRASLTHGLLLSLQQAGLGLATHSSVPPIHRQDGRGNAAAGGGSMNGSTELEMNPGATEYLSRLLIMLGSFVLLCLLLL